MSTMEKIKKIIIISIGFALATYLIMSGSAMLSAEATVKESSDANHTTY